MAITVKVGGVDRSAYWQRNTSLRWEDILNGRSTGSIRFADVIGGWVPEDGQEFLVLEDGTRRFGGMLVEPEEDAPPSTNLLFFDCKFVDFSALCDRFLVARVYTSTLLGDIAKDIIDQDMGSEGIDVSGVEDGPMVDTAVFNYLSVTECFNELSQSSGLAWWIDAEKLLHFATRSSIPAPFDLDGDVLIGDTVRLRPDRSLYRNRQILRAGTDLTDPRIETFVGDGERQTFNLAFKAGTEPTVTVNGVSQTVGIRGVETGKNWYWNKGETEFTQDDAATRLVLTDMLAVTYQGLFPIVIDAQLDSEIASRAAIEGGSGVYTKVEDKSEIDSTAAATSEAQARLDRYGSIKRILSGNTRQSGFAPGQIAAATFPEHGLSGEAFLIETVDAEVPGDLDELWYSLKCFEGDPYGGWQRYFRRIMAVVQAPSLSIRENEVVIQLRSLSDSVVATDALVADAAAPESRIDHAKIDYSVVA